MAVEQERHRPGLLKQTNKTHKHGKHKSKGSVETLRKGKVNVKTISKKLKKSSREDRRNQASQIRKNKRDEVLSNRRKLLEAPFMVAVLPLSNSIVIGDVIEMIEKADAEAIVTHSSEGHLHLSLPRFKQRFSFVLVDTSNIFHVLDALKAADTALFVMSPTEGIDAVGHVLLSAISAQGLPTSAVALFNLNDVPIKKRNECKQDLEKAVQKYIPEEKAMGLSNSMDVLNIMRKIGNQKQRKIVFRDRRPHLLAEKLDFIYKENVNRHSSIYDSNIGLPVFPSEFKYMPESNYEILATLTTSDDVEKFISLYSHNSCSEWRVLRTYTRVPPTILYKRAWRCQYNVQQRARVKDINRIKVSKNCHCPGYICITLYSSSAKRGFEEDFKYKDYRARIKLNLDHNHDLNSREALQKRTLDPTIKDKIVGMFQYGHGASTSIKVHLLDLLMINEEQYFNLIHNGSYMPSVSQVQHYLNHYKKEMELLDLNDIVEEYLLANPEARVKHFCIHSEDNKVVNIITPLMLKVHQHIPRSGEVITVSISEKINRLGTKLLTLTTHWDLGPLPLGLIVLQQNDAKIGTVKGNIIAEALTEFALSTASENFFYGFYYTFKKILFSSSAEETQKHFSELSTFCVDACPSYLKYIVSLMLYQHLWLNYHRKEKLKKLHLSHIELETSSHVEILSAYVYHQMLMKIKNLFLNLPQVLDFVLNHLESYYYVRMLKLLNDGYPRSMMSKYLETEEEPEEFALQPSDYDNDCYFVMSGDVYHYVDYKHKLCSTNMKNASSPCAHINAVLNYKMETSVLSEQDVEVNERVRELCKLLLGDHYSNLRVDERSVIVINTDTRRLICENSYVNQTETGNVTEIVIETHVEDDENAEHDVQYSHVIDSHITEIIHQEETETISSDEVEIVTVSCSDFNKDKTQMGMQMNLEACSKFIRNTLLEATEEDEIQIVEEDNAPDVTKATDIKQKPPDEMPGKSLKRKLNSRESTSNVDMAISSSKLIAVQIPGSTSKLVNLKSVVDQCPQRVSVQDLLRNEDSIAETVNLTVELESKSIIPQNSEAASQNQRIVINQKTGIVQVVGNESNRVLTVPRLSTQRSVFSLSDNVIIIDPHVKKETGVSNAKKFVDSESELKKFNEICERIKQNPSQYKTVMRNMIDVYETFYGD